MKLKYSFEIMELDDQIMAVPVGDNASEFHGLLRLNNSASQILDLFQEDTTEEAVCEILEKKYENSNTEIEKWVHFFCDQLKDAGILQ